MSKNPCNLIKLKKAPNIKTLLIKAALKRRPSGDRDLNAHKLPSTQFQLDDVKLERALIQSFHSVVCWNANADILHPCYLHTLAFPLHLKLLLLPSSPFPILGLIHISNQIKQERPIKNEEHLSITACFGGLNKHAKGWSFCIKIAVYSCEELVWSSQSQYLSQTKSDTRSKIEREIIHKSNAQHIIAEQYLNKSLGRQYAKASGDFNPIHLTKLSAKIFGLKSHIIHGMWTKAFCLSVLQKNEGTRLNVAFEVNVEFKQPLYLPSHIFCSLEHSEPSFTDRRINFKVHSTKYTNTYTHLSGTLKVI